FDAGEGIGIGAVGADAEAVEKRASDNMRRVAAHRTDADIDARLPEKHRAKLRMRIGDVQDAGVAEALESVDARIVGAACEPRQAAGKRGGACERQEVPAADGHASLRASKGVSVFPCPSSGSSRWWPGRLKPWPTPRPPWRMRWPCRSRRRQRPSWP